MLDMDILPPGESVHDVGNEGDRRIWFASRAIKSLSADQMSAICAYARARGVFPFCQLFA